jgi:YVTN family beta-propeller protein
MRIPARSPLVRTAPALVLVLVSGLVLASLVPLTAQAATSNLQVTSTIPVGNGPSGVAVNATTNTVYVANIGDNSVSVIDGVASTVTSTIPVGSGPTAVAVDSTTNTVYVTNDGADSVSVIDGATSKVTSTILLGSAPQGVAVDAITNTIYVTKPFVNSVSVIDGVTGTVTSAINVGFAPQGVAVNETTNTVYVVNTGDKSVSVVDGATGTVTSTIPVGGYPHGMAVDATTNTVYVTNPQDASVSVISSVPVSRLSGPDRFSTSAAISAASFAPGVPVVYIANGYNFPDALSAAPVAGKGGAPVLLVSADAIPSAIQTELTRLKPGRIVVLGGVNAVSDAVKTTLQQYTVGTVTRLSGSDRFSTSAAISAAAFAPGVPVAYIANGFNFPDALSAAPVAGKDGAPVLLVSADAIPAVIQTELIRLKPGRIVVLGGVNAVSDAVKATLQSDTVGAVSRLSGPDRFSTSAAISAASFAPGVPVVYIANGYNFPDALSAAPVAGKDGAPVLLVSADSIQGAIQTELTRLKPGRIVVLGGVNAVSDTVSQQLISYISK